MARFLTDSQSGTMDAAALAQALLAAEQTLDALFTQNSDGLMIVGPAGGLLFANPAARDLLAAIPATLDQLFTAASIRPGAAGEIELQIPATPRPASVQSTAEANRSTSLTIELRFSPTTWKGETASLVTLRNVTDRTAGMASPASVERTLQNSLEHPFAGTVLTDEAEGRIILFIRNVTDRLAAERTERARQMKEGAAEIQFANEELARMGRLKDEFLANMSHELRTPLNAILSLTQLLEVQLAPLLAARHQRSLQTIAESGHHVLELIDEILDLTKIQSGKMTFHLENVAVESICRSGMEIVKQASEVRGQSLSLEIAPGVVAVRADRLRLRQILVNLLSNAVKFTPAHGAIGIEVHPAARPGFISFTVWDTGIGISAEDIGRLFQPFVQLDTPRDREYEGSGLGLALSAHLARQQGGELSVVSRLGKGSRFTLALPSATGPISVGPIRSVFEKRNNATAMAGQLILLVEDNEANIFALSEYLEFKEYQVAVARTGVEALEMIHRLRPAIVLMDVHLPRMDGLEVTRRLRADARFQSLPIVAVTALAMADDRERCLAAGATDYLAKPIDLERLDRLLVHYLTSPSG